MISILLFFASVYLTIRVAMADLYDNFQNIYSKWESKAKTKMQYVSSEMHTGDSILKKNNSHARQTKKVSFSDLKTTYAPPTTRLQNNVVRFKTNFSSSPLKQDGLSTFKVAPTVASKNALSRPVMGLSCTKCVPHSRRETSDETTLSLGMTNLFNSPSGNSNHQIIKKLLHHASFLLRRDAGHVYHDVSSKVQSCERVQASVDKAIKDVIEGDSIDDQQNSLSEEQIQLLHKKYQNRVFVILQQMKCCISPLLLRLASWVMFKLLGRMLVSTQVHKGQVEMLKKVSKKKIPVIYLPLHRSHLDYILITFSLYLNNIKVPLVAAGDNLKIPFFGTLLRGLGAFFIKRKLDPQKGKKDVIYRSVLHSYMAESLKKGHSLEFFIEGGRSRSGKACMPKAGLLSVVVDSLMEGAFDDAFIVPVAVSYEKLMDGSFTFEQLGKTKVQENFSSALRAVWKTVHSSFGSVRIDFCQPFSLKEFLTSAKKFGPAPPLSSFPALESSGSSGQLRSSSSTSSLYGVDVVSEEHRQIIKDLAEHVVYDASNSMALMSTNVFAFLMLTKYRKGATIQQLAHSFTWIKEEIIARKSDVGFTGEPIDVVKHAANLLGKNLISTETVQMAWSSRDMENNNVKIVFLKPMLHLPNILELQYYANNCLSVFLLDSIVANALFALVNDDLSVLRGTESTIVISQTELLKKSLQLCDILQYEFIFAPPCTSLSSAISETIENFITAEILSVEQEITKCSNKKRTFADNLQFSDPEDEEDEEFNDSERKLKVLLLDDSVSRLQFYRCILSPFIESYWLAAISLFKLVGIEKDEKLFFTQMYRIAEDRLHQGLLCYEESFAADTLRSAIKLFEHWKVLKSYLHETVKILYLQQEHNTVDAITQIVAQIEEFK